MLDEGEIIYDGELKIYKINWGRGKEEFSLSNLSEEVSIAELVR